LQATAERAPFTREQSEVLLDMTSAGVESLIAEQLKAIAS